MSASEHRATVRWAIVTGAAKRIGRVIALDLAKAGWNIVVHYHTSQEDAVSLVEAIQDLGRQACLAEIDLADAKATAKLIPALADALGPIGLLVNNASLFEKDDKDPTGEKHWAINRAAPEIMGEAFSQIKGDYLRTIINILDADPSKPEFTAYNKSKAALRQLTLQQARTFAPAICVHGLALGAILANPRESSEHFQAMVDRSPLRCHPSPEDIASTILFLIRMRSMTGNILALDGGAHLIGADQK